MALMENHGKNVLRVHMDATPVYQSAEHPRDRAPAVKRTVKIVQPTSQFTLAMSPYFGAGKPLLQMTTLSEV